jgi:DNA-binding response OmpR family regulator
MQPRRELKSRRMLVVDDDDAVLDLLTTRLILGGYRVTTACNGFEALRAMKNCWPDGMILDLNMPVLDGFGVLERLRASSIRPPILVLTARYCAKDVEEAIRLGATDYLAKPFDDRMLLARVSRLFRSLSPAGRDPTTVET